MHTLSVCISDFVIYWYLTDIFPNNLQLCIFIEINMAEKIANSFSRHF